MSDVAFAHDVMRDFVAARPGESAKEKIRSASNALRWTYARTKAVFYGEHRLIKADELDQLCKAAKVKRSMRELADERDELRARLDRMEAMLATLVSAVEGEDPSPAKPRTGGLGRFMGAGTALRNA